MQKSLGVCEGPEEYSEIVHPSHVVPRRSENLSVKIDHNRFRKNDACRGPHGDSAGGLGIHGFNECLDNFAEFLGVATTKFCDDVGYPVAIDLIVIVHNVANEDEPFRVLANKMLS